MLNRSGRKIELWHGPIYPAHLVDELVFVFYPFMIGLMVVQLTFFWGDEQVQVARRLEYLRAG